MKTLSKKLLIILLVVLITVIGINGLLLYRNITNFSDTQIRLETKQRAEQLASYIEQNMLSDDIDSIFIKELGEVIEMMNVQVAVNIGNRKIPVYNNIPVLILRRIQDNEKLIYSRAYVKNQKGDTLAFITVVEHNNEITYINQLFKAATINSLILGIVILILFFIILYILVNRPLKKVMSAMEDDMPIEFKKSSDWQAVAAVHNTAHKKRIEQKAFQNQFLQNASHELKSPLMNIQGYMEGLEDKLYSQKEASELVASESQRIKQLIDQMIRSSKAEVIETNDLKPEFIDMKSFINDLNKMIPKTIKLVYDSNKKDFYFDKIVLHIIMSNLIQNACRYTKDTIFITYNYLDENKDSYETTNKKGMTQLIVRDNGNGIDSEIQNTLFNRFVKGIDGKTGLGLSIVKRYVETTNGTIKSYNDNGAVFEIIW